MYRWLAICLVSPLIWACSDRHRPPAAAPSTRPAQTAAAQTRPAVHISTFDGIRQVEITQDETGIDMTVTTVDESTQAITIRYKAATPAALEKRSYDAYLLYQKAMAAHAQSTTAPSK